MLNHISTSENARVEIQTNRPASQSLISYVRMAVKFAMRSEKARAGVVFGCNPPYVRPAPFTSNFRNGVEQRIGNAGSPAMFGDEGVIDIAAGFTFQGTRQGAEMDQSDGFAQRGSRDASLKRVCAIDQPGPHGIGDDGVIGTPVMSAIPPEKTSPARPVAGLGVSITNSGIVLPRG